METKRKSTADCKYFAKGYCRYENRCKFAHVKKQYEKSNKYQHSLQLRMTKLNNRLKNKFLWHPDVTFTVNEISKPAPLTWQHLNLYISQFMQMPMPLIKLICSYFGNYDFSHSQEREVYSYFQTSKGIVCGFCKEFIGPKIFIEYFCQCKALPYHKIAICSSCWPLMHNESIAAAGMYLIEWIKLNDPCRIISNPECSIKDEIWVFDAIGYFTPRFLC